MRIFHFCHFFNISYNFEWKPVLKSDPNREKFLFKGIVYIRLEAEYFLSFKFIKQTITQEKRMV